MSAEINAADLPPDLLREMGVKLPRQAKFTADDMRRFALKCLAALAGLTRQQRERVLKHALKVNRV